VDADYHTEDEKNVTILVDECIDYGEMDRIYTVNEDNRMEIEYFQNGTQCRTQKFVQGVTSYSIPWRYDTDDDSSGSGIEQLVSNNKLLDLIIICSGILVVICAVCVTAFLHRTLKRLKAKKQERRGLGAQLVPKQKQKPKEREDSQIGKEGVSEAVYDDNSAESMSVEVDEIALIAVPMPADPVPAFADNMIMEQNENESDHEEQAQDAVEEEILEIEADDDRVSEDEGEGEGQGFVESDIES